MPLPWPFQRDPLPALATRARVGDERAFCELYELLYPRVWSFVVRRTATRADAEDVTSRAFHRLLERLPGLDGGRNVLAFALAIARNLLIDDLRARRTTLSLEDAGAALVDERSPLGDLLREEELRRLRAELERLPAESRELVALRFGDELGHAEIAALLGLSEAAVRQRVSRTLRTLKAALVAAAEREEVAHGP